VAGVKEKKPQKDPLHWFERTEGHIQPREALACAFFLIAHGFDTDKERSEWVRRVRLDRNGALQLKEKWTPLSLDQGGWGKKNGVSLIFEPMERAVRSVWEDAELDAIGIAMQQWGGEGQFDGLRASQLRDWLSHTPPIRRRECGGASKTRSSTHLRAGVRGASSRSQR
jgi:hypothetical protein